MKVLFLDFDGVLNIGKYENPWFGNCSLKKGYVDRDEFGLLFDTFCVQNLQTIIETTGAKIVISSSWRYLGLDRILLLWNARQLPGEVIDIIPLDDTGNNNGNQSRGDYIEEWLSEHPIDGYVIIDDTDDFSNEQKKYLVQTDEKEGLVLLDTKNAIDLLQASK